MTNNSAPSYINAGRRCAHEPRFPVGSEVRVAEPDPTNMNRAAACVTAVNADGSYQVRLQGMAADEQRSPPPQPPSSGLILSHPHATAVHLSTPGKLRG